MRVTVVPIRGHVHPDFAPVEQSWEPDESANHDSHTALNPSCARCVVGTGDFKLKEPDKLPEPDLTEA
jgi:hypothetical protein